MTHKSYKVYFIQHSTFLVELEDKYLLFDYFDKNTISSSVSLEGHLPELNPEKMLYVFASHGHKDHFSESVLEIAKERDNVKFILSKDIKLGFNYFGKNGFKPAVKKNVYFLGPEKKVSVDDLKIETLRSNEAGVAFIVTTDNICIYHAGDLNWWNTEGKGELYGEQYGREYRRALRPILNRHVDIGFVVLDSRLNEDGYFLGLDYFIKHIDCSHIFPMHMWGKYDYVERFKDRPDIANLRDRIVDIDQENMLFEIED